MLTFSKWIGSLGSAASEAEVRGREGGEEVVGVIGMFRQQRDWAQIPRLFGLDCELLRVQTFVNCWLPRIAS